MFLLLMVCKWEKNQEIILHWEEIPKQNVCGPRTLAGYLSRPWDTDLV